MLCVFCFVAFVFFFFLMIRRPPRSTPLYSSAASDVYKRQGCCAVAELGVERDVIQGRGCHGGADLSFDEGGDEQRQELAAEQCFDPGRVLQQHWCGVLDAFEEVVAPFEVGLVTVRGEYLGVRQVAVISDQWEAAIAGGVVGDVVQGDVGGQGEPVGGDLPVARFGSGPATSCLLVRLDGALGDGGGDPPVGVSLRQCGGDRDAQDAHVSF